MIRVDVERELISKATGKLRPSNSVVITLTSPDSLFDDSDVSGAFGWDKNTTLKSNPLIVGVNAVTIYQHLSDNTIIQRSSMNDWRSLFFNIS